MVYHGLPHEPRQPEDAIRFAQFIARPPRIVFSHLIGRDVAMVHDDLDTSEVRTVVLNVRWRPEVVEAGLAHLIYEPANTAADRPADPVEVPEAHMYSAMLLLLRLSLVVAAGGLGALVALLVGRLR